MKPGLECGVDAAPSADELMLNLLSRQPLWIDYNPSSFNTQRVMDLFRPSDLPNGHLNEVITFNKNSFNSSLVDQISSSKYQDFILLTNILMDSK